MLRDLFEDLDELKPRVLVNTFDALEPERAPRRARSGGSSPSGPVVPDGEASLSSSSTDMFRRDDASACVDWLDTKPARSVVYVSFGTLLSMSKRQEEEMRRGLEATGRPYLWVARQGAVDGGATLDSAPTPAADAAGGGGEGDAQGMVVEWCDQMKVLSHPAVGCFVSHCGWNSALESVSAGVPMVAWPLYAEQKVNAVILTEEVAGVALCPAAARGGDGVVAREEVAAAVKELMDPGEKGSAMRRRAREMQVAAARARSPEGASCRALTVVVGKWKNAVQEER
jgi:Glycosyl transferases, related to UDP-glucuronosyltransferase